MSKKRELADLDERLSKLEGTVDTIKSRISVLEDRLFSLEYPSRKGDGAQDDVLDLSQVPVDTRKENR